MSILFALAIAAAQPAAPAGHVQHAQPAAPADHAQHQQHAEHMKEMQKHHEQCEAMMERMHPGMKHDGHKPTDGKPGAELQEHGSR